MRIKQLDLKAFGPFTDHVLDFSSKNPGLHIVYGPNEAGKSSCLRALKSLFFGIPAQTNDNFLHPYDQLVIGGCLQGEDSHELTFFRRKKRKSDLFDQNDDPLDPARLAPFLQGMEQEMFESLYGIDHEALVRGGQDMLDQKGDVGQAIFAAGAGLKSLHTVFEELEKEGDDLFKPRASTKAINEALSQYRDLQTQMKQASLSSREWQEHRRALQKADKDLIETKAMRSEKDREKRRLERLQRALPYLNQRKILMENLVNLGNVIVLPADFGEQRKILDQERNDATNRLNAADSRMDEIQKRKDGVSLQQGLLNRAGEIEEVYQRLGEYRKATADRPRLEGMRIKCKTDAATLLKEIRPDLPLDHIESLRPGLSRRKTIYNLGNRYEALVQKIEQADREIR
ncbi:MAG: AAA family ATPase, partial [Deltaproteobacteria bacterium]